MKRIFKQNAGLTLIELVVAMAIATVVTAAATSVLMLGLNINRQTGDTASRQMTVSTLLNTVEGIIAEGNVSDIEMNTEHWQIKDKSQKVLLSYVFKEETLGTVYVGDYEALTDTDPETTATPVLTGLLSSYVELYDGLFTIMVETKEGMYTSSVYCRALTPETDSDVSNGNGYIDQEKGDNLPPLTLFLNALKSQYRSRGEIIGANQTDQFQYFSEWYIGLDYDDGVYDNGWNAKTPWCACYVSWALVKAGVASPVADHPRWYANVDEFMAYFQAQAQGSKWLEAEPKAGDLLFFDWNKGTNPQHMGVVLKVEGNMVYTIEGNSAGRVTVRSYPIGDERIIGYGRLPGLSE